MSYVKTENGVAVKYPYTLEDLAKDHPNTFFPDHDFSSVGVFEVTVDPVPEYDNEAVEVTLAAMPELRDGQWVRSFVSTPLSAERIASAKAANEAKEISEFVAAANQRLQDFVATRAYDSVDSASKYKDLSDEDLALIPEHLRAYVLKFRAESRYILRVTAWTWAKLYTILDEVKSGQRQKPASFADLEAELPVLNWEHAV